MTECYWVALEKSENRIITEHTSRCKAVSFMVFYNRSTTVNQPTSVRTTSNFGNDKDL